MNLFLSFLCLLGFGLVLTFGQQLIEHVDVISGAKWRSRPVQYNSCGNYAKTLGSLPRPSGQRPQLPTMKPKQFNVKDLPTHFDSRTRWPNCSTIGFIWDQAGCHSCWAVSAASVFSDRLCIHRGIDVQLSATDVLACCEYCGYGCEGGYQEKAWEYYEKEGLVTGGDGSTCNGCLCYPFPRCKECSNAVEPQPTPECVKECRPESRKLFVADKYFGGKAAYVPAKEEVIRYEIMTNGPVQANFRAFDDLKYYESGVYYHTFGPYLGGHDVRLIGWGEEGGTRYWLAANSWCTNWGEKGFFKIRRGNNECSIEEQVIAGLPR